VLSPVPFQFRHVGTTESLTVPGEPVPDAAGAALQAPGKDGGWPSGIEADDAEITVDMTDADPLNDLKVLFQPKNQGKGAAVRSALSHVTGDIVVIQDADLEYDPRDYMRLLEPILSGQADVVYGTRFYGGGPHRVLFFWHYLGNQILTLVSNVLTNLNLTDMEVGYKVFKSEVLKNINLKSDRFGFEPEITMKVAKKKCRVYEVPISYHGRTYAEGKKITWKDGIATFYTLIRYWLWD